MSNSLLRQDFLWPRVYRSTAEIAAEEVAAARRIQVPL